MRNKGQVAVFVIVGVLLVVVIGLFFLFRSGGIPSAIGGFEEDPQLFIERCIEPKVKESIDLMLKQGGYTDPVLYKEFQFNGEKSQNISYLCHTPHPYIYCINLEPVLIKHLEDEISTYIGEDLEECFSDWKTNMEKQNYKVNLGSLNYSVNLEPNQIIVEANRGISLNKKEESFQYEEFRVVIRNKLYDLSILSQEILSQEAEFCNFDHLGYMILYSDFDIDKFRTGDLDTIYTIIDKKSGDKMRFAIRGCVIPSGI